MSPRSNWNKTANASNIMIMVINSYKRMCEGNSCPVHAHTHTQCNCGRLLPERSPLYHNNTNHQIHRGFLRHTHIGLELFYYTYWQGCTHRKMSVQIKIIVILHKVARIMLSCWCLNAKNNLLIEASLRGFDHQWNQNFLIPLSN